MKLSNYPHLVHALDIMLLMAAAEKIRAASPHEVQEYAILRRERALETDLEEEVDLEAAEKELGLIINGDFERLVLGGPDEVGFNVSSNVCETLQAIYDLI